MAELEYCCVCGDATDRAGRADDSLYVETIGDEIGPLCVRCYDKIQSVPAILKYDGGCHCYDRLADAMAKRSEIGGEIFVPNESEAK